MAIREESRIENYASSINVLKPNLSLFSEGRLGPPAQRVAIEAMHSPDMTWLAQGDKHSSAQAGMSRIAPDFGLYVGARNDVRLQLT
jgi:hypothetical protein